MLAELPPSWAQSYLCHRGEWGPTMVGGGLPWGSTLGMHASLGVPGQPPACVGMVLVVLRDTPCPQGRGSKSPSRRERGAKPPFAANPAPPPALRDLEACHLTCALPSIHLENWV